jgi:hypothetical protein
VADENYPEADGGPRETSKADAIDKCNGSNGLQDATHVIHLQSSLL